MQCSSEVHRQPLHQISYPWSVTYHLPILIFSPLCPLFVWLIIFSFFSVSPCARLWSDGLPAGQPREPLRLDPLQDLLPARRDACLPGTRLQGTISC